MHDRSSFIQARLRRLLSERIQTAVDGPSLPLDVAAWEVPDEPISFSEAVNHQFLPFSAGSRWGRPWGTVWFHATGTVPPEWHDAELAIDLGFVVMTPGFQAEGTVYRADGTVVKAVESRNQYVKVGPAGSHIDFYIEAAANPDIAGPWDFAPTPLGEKATAGNDLLYRLVRIDVVRRNIEVWELAQDVRTLLGLVEQLSPDLPRRAEILRALEQAADALDPDDVPATASAARAALASVLASPAYASAHQITAVGHAHIDSAWLWPTRETKRKVARTFSNVLALMDEEPDFVFAASSAQQFQWLKESQPELFDRVRQRVIEGRFAVVGGMWVEADTNMPGGEAMARQFVAGKRFFMEEFGVEPLEVWLPDSFGYSGALPQIVAAAGFRWFLTQKISWNDTNRMPHHTFYWEGIDGSRIFTHFPPADTYNAELNADELFRAQRQYAEKGAANSSLIPFGYGDGGGGPTREMIAAAHRAQDLEGSPRVSLGTPQGFFESAEAEYPSAPVWRGEMYLEFHRGTYTSQARTKRGNRRSEHLLREAELWATLNNLRTGGEYPYSALEKAWHTVLLQQFHDILPGSSIAWVHREAERNYADLADAVGGIIAASLASLAGAGTETITFNSGPYGLDSVPALSGGMSDGGAFPVSVRADGVGAVIENDLVRVSVDNRGLIVSIYDITTDREMAPPGMPGNMLQLFRDTPNHWDAWDIDKNYENVVEELTGLDSLSVDSDAIVISRSFGASSIVQRVTLHGASIDIANRIDWHEKQKLLKLAFPVDVYAERASSEIQFGHIHRPTHANTSWDAARFETVAHRWVHVGESNYGVAVANDSTYGHDIRSVQTPGGKPSTVVRLSLLRAPLYPDPDSDQGVHEMVVSVQVGASIADAVALGYRLNLPLRQVVGGAGPVAPVFAVDTPAVVIETVKLAEDRSGDVVVRLYEAFGSRARALLTPGFGFADVVRTDLLERRTGDVSLFDGRVQLKLRPFEIVTLRFRRD